MREEFIPAEIEPKPDSAKQASITLQRLGFRILHIGKTISVEAPATLWTEIFNVSFAPEKKTLLVEVERGDVVFQRADTEALRITEALEELISGVMFPKPPELY